MAIDAHARTNGMSLTYGVVIPAYNAARTLQADGRLARDAADQDVHERLA